MGRAARRSPQPNCRAAGTAQRARAARSSHKLRQATAVHVTVPRAAAPQGGPQGAHSGRGPRAAADSAAAAVARGYGSPRDPCAARLRSSRGHAAGLGRAPQPPSHVAAAMQRSGPHVAAQRARAARRSHTLREATAVRMIGGPRCPLRAAGAVQRAMAARHSRTLQPQCSAAGRTLQRSWRGQHAAAAPCARLRQSA
jgi:hypothetical protein